MEMNIHFPLDSDGYLSQECPACEQRFKVRFGQGSPEPVGHCPYCAHAGVGCWFTTEQVEYAQAKTYNEFLAPKLDELGREVDRLNRGGGFLSFGVKRTPDMALAIPQEDDRSMELKTFSCHGETIKHEPGVSAPFCPICGSPA